MNIEKRVCTVQQAIKLRELGVTGKSLCYYVSEIPGAIDGLELVVAFGYSWSDHPCYSSYSTVINAFGIYELGQMIGKGTIASERFWQYLIDCVNSGLSSTVAFNAVSLAGFVITQIEINNIDVAACNRILVE